MAILKNLSALDKFKCIAENCPDSCCEKGWDIDIDENTFNLWNESEQPEFRKKLLDNITLKNNKRIIKLFPNGKCCHLDKDCLCSIQKQLGEEYLTKICAKYPRIAFKNHEMLTHTAQLSCPEIIRMVLLMDRDKLFHTETITAEELSQIEDTCTFIDEPMLIRLRSIIMEYFSRSILVEPLDFGVWLYDLADVITDFTKRISEDSFSFDRLQKKCGKSKKNIQNRFVSIKKELRKNKISIDSSIENNYWMEVLKLYQDNEIKGLDDLPGLTQVNRSIGKVIQKNFRILNKKINLQEKLINYAIVKFHNHGFPWYPYQGNYVATYIQCVLPVCIVILLVVLYEASGKSVDEALLTKIIYKIETKFGQNTYIFQLLQAGHYFTRLEKYKSAFLQLG